MQDFSDFISDKIITFLAKYPNNAVIAEIESMKLQILEDVAKQGVSIDKTKLTEVNLIKRMVMKKCIYGVDINEMAVELAKLSLWLDSFTLGAPLSFLDHHLKCGNSLIGAINIADHIPPGSERYNTFFRAMTNLFQVGEITDATISEVVRSRKLYEDAVSWIYPTKERINIHIARHFIDIGNEGQTMQWAYKDHKDRLAKDSFEKRSLGNFVKAQEVATKKRFFHWELEYPEVFYDTRGEKEDAGFDVVIGNPPYINIEEISPDDREYLMKSGKYTTTIKRMDIFIPFHEISIKLLRNKGTHSFIVPFPLLTQDYGQKLRVFFLDNTRIRRIVDLSKYKIFPDAVVRNIIPFFEKEKVNSDYPIEVVSQDKDPNEIQKISGHTKLINASQFRDTYKNMFRIDLTPEVQKIQKKMDSVAIKFGKIFVASWGARGVPVEKFHLDNPINSNCKRMVKGSDVDRYELLYSGKWLLYDIEKLYRPSMPEFFEHPKIIFQKVTGKHGLIGVYDKEKFYTDDSLICCIPKYWFEGYDEKHLRKHKIYIKRDEITISKDYDILYVLGVMNSQINGFYFSKFVGYDLNVYPENIEYLPIPPILFNTSEKIRHELLEASCKLYDNAEYGAILRWADTELFENRNDAIHDFLTYLVRQMIAKKKEVQIMARKFLDWIENEIVKGSVDGLRNKTKLKEFHSHSVDTFFEVLKENKCITDPTPSKIRILIENEFSQTMGQLGPLKGEIKSTDQLINQFVHKLYNLAEEDIQVIERSINWDTGNP